MEFKEGRRYHSGHTWAQSLGNGHFRIGIDSFAATLLRSSLGVVFPALGTEMKQGGAGVWMTDETGSIPIRMPLTGRLEKINEAVCAHPASPLHDPYGEGWLIEVSCSKPDGEIASLDSPSEASARSAVDWERFTAKLKGRKKAQVGQTLQDGGELHPEIRSIVGAATYRRAVLGVL